jgi:hypothetical protein
MSFVEIGNSFFLAEDIKSLDYMFIAISERWVLTVSMQDGNERDIDIRPCAGSGKMTEEEVVQKCRQIMEQVVKARAK